MKVLFDHSLPFALAHGGFQIQIEQTKAALEGIGVEAEYVRWWDEGQRGEVLHYFGRPVGFYVQAAQHKKQKVVLAELLTALGSRSPSERLLQKGMMRAATRLLPGAFTARLGWDAYRRADACVALTPWEAQLMTEMFDAPSARVHCVPNGVEKAFLESQPAARGRWLVCTATITERKRTLELAEAAVEAATPIWIIGKPYAEEDPYAVRFHQFVRTHSDLVRYEGGVGDRLKLAAIYREARGFVLLSTMESLSLSALEAAACECPLLLSDLPWARCTFEQNASYTPIGSTAVTAASLRRFYEQAPSLPVPPRPLSWPEVALRFKALYDSLLNSSR